MTVKGKLLRAPLEGDSRVVLGDSPGFLLSGAWLSPERLLLGGSLTSYSMHPSGGSLEPFKELYRWPQMLPGGEHILYMAWDSNTNRHRARVARFGDPGSARDLIESDSRVLYTASLANPGAGYLMYLRAGNLLAQPFDPRSLRITGEALPVVNKVYSFRNTGAADFSVSSGGAIAYQSFASRSQLVWVDRKGRQVGSAGPRQRQCEIRPPITGRAEAGDRDLRCRPRRSESVICRYPEQRRARIDAGTWHPGRAQVCIRGTGENDAEEALAPVGFQIPTDWSPDGRFIVFENTGIARLSSEIQSDVLMIELAHGRKVIPLLSTPFHESNAAFSPDGKWLTFTSNESGRPEVYVQAFESTGTPRVTGERHIVTRSGAQALRWRRDGKELFYLALDGRVYAVPARLSPKPEFGPATPLFSISTEARAAIHSVPGFDVSPDGQRFLIPAVTSQDGPSLIMMQNWEAALPQNQPKTIP